MTKKNHQPDNIRPEMQRRIAKTGRMASGAGKTMKATNNSKANNTHVNG
ncbi:MAG: hypothetical protein KW802_03670 [Candidatus Doudnabacteria bacterium]|nr:hypothetical protein [Candidatus Doudnabacteria bacterium]